MKKNDGSQCGTCDTCGKCNDQNDCGIRMYTLIIYSENIAGLLNQITAVFTRRQVNIESLNVCASSTPGVHKYTISCYCTEEMVKMLTKQIEKKIDVLQANYFLEDEIYIQETALFKLSTPVVLSNKNVSRIVRFHDARIVEVNPNYVVVEKSGMTDDILALYEKLKDCDCVLQFARTGRICITKGCVELLDEYLKVRMMKYDLQKTQQQ
jgi:acetolactate synthase-1/3 small subunit